jgi:basic membrane protein A
MKSLKMRLLFVLASLISLCLFQTCSVWQESQDARPSKPTVLLITDSSGEIDESFNQAAFMGILDFYGETWNNQTNRGILYNTFRCKTETDYTSAITGASKGKWDVIVVTGFSFADALAEAAPQYPNQKFMIVDADWVNKPNVAQYMFAEHEGSYLVGAAVALKAVESGIEDPVFGFIGGFPSSTITKFEVGYIEGIRSILPQAKIVDFYADSWDAPELASAKTKTWYDDGVFAVFTAAGGTGVGL